MRALQMDSPADDSSTTRVVEIAAPAPGPGEVTIDVAYAGINFIDVMTRRGDPGYAPSGWPLVAGREVAGTIREVGPGVEGFNVGDRVAALVTSGLAEVAVASSKVVALVPDEVSVAEAASAPLMLATAVLLLRTAAQVRPGDRVFMHSASGGVASVAAQVARVLGAGLTVGSVAGASGTDASWDHLLAQDDDLREAALRVCPDGFDVILDPTGTTSLDFDLAVAAPGARVVLFGNTTGRVPTALPSFRSLLGGNLGLVGFSITSLVLTHPERVADALATGLAMVATKDVRVSVTIVESLDDAGGVHDLLAHRAGVGKYVVRVQG